MLTKMYPVWYVGRADGQIRDQTYDPVFFKLSREVRLQVTYQVEEGIKWQVWSQIKEDFKHAD